MIRMAVLSDTDACFNMAKDIYGETLASTGIEIDDKDLRSTVDYFIRSNQAMVIERDDSIVGMTAWIITFHPANASCKVFQEMLWCCNSPIKSDALALLRAIERKSKESKANIVIVANLNLANEPKLKSIYNRMKYIFLESHYAKTLC